MAENGWILMSFCLMLMIPTADFCFSVPTTEIYILKRLGEDATLPCLNMNAIRDNCSSIKWMTFGRQVLEISPGETGEKGQKYSDRLTMTANCSLVVKKVTVEDAGRYYCQQYKSENQGPAAQTVIDLSVVNISEQKYPNGTVSGIECSVVTTGMGCHYSLMWGWDHNVDSPLVRVKKCYASVRFMGSADSTKNSLMKCKAMNGITGEEHLFTFSLQPSESTTSASSTEGTTGPVKVSTALANVSDDETGETKSTTKKPTRNTENSTEPSGAMSNPLTDVKGSGRFTIVCVVSAALLITVVTLMIWIKTKGNKHQMDYVIHHNEHEDDAALNSENATDSFSIRLY